MPDATASPLHGTSGDLAAPLLEPPSETTQTKRAAGVRRILQQSRPEWPAMAAATLCLLLAVLGQAVMPLLFGRMVDATADTSGSRDARLRRYSAACAELALVVGVSLCVDIKLSRRVSATAESWPPRHRRGLHAIDATSARRRGGVVSHRSIQQAWTRHRRAPDSLVDFHTEGDLLWLDVDLLLRLDGLVQAAVPSPPFHDPARELVDDLHFALVH